MTNIEAIRQMSVYDLSELLLCFDMIGLDSPQAVMDWLEEESKFRIEKKVMVYPQVEGITPTVVKKK